MAKQTFLSLLKEKIGGLAFRIFLWSGGLTEEEFWEYQKKQAFQGCGSVCISGKYYRIYPEDKL